MRNANTKWVLNTPEAKNKARHLSGLTAKHALSSAFALLFMPISPSHADLPSSCSNSGQTRYNSTTHQLEYCEGAYWTPVGIPRAQGGNANYFYKGRLFLITSQENCPSDSVEIAQDGSVALCYDAQIINSTTYDVYDE